ncbi:Hsp70 family protein [Planctellipticum variicoloris]|uniref:Hsp70 family protein n=1 Tax=Planctellipticum variicoloris TaxID=3064265 RepID=UPI003013A2FF|nr:Hsp70 family protein [Planctomycetaceae bacterium SH412]
MLPTHAVGIDLGTTYSCIAYLNEHGEPITIPNPDGELSTPSAVLVDGDRFLVGMEAIRNSIRHPDRVIQDSKRWMGDASKVWQIAGKRFTPVDVATIILRSLLENARQRIGEIDRAVITVPAQFSDIQRQATAEAGRRAGLKHVDIINEPVAAALCFVLGTEGIWFTELATSQLIMVADLGGGTFDLSLVRYQKNEVRVVASGGDLHLGGLDWNQALQKAIARQFQREFGPDPLADRESAQALSLEVEQVKRSLSVRPRAALTCQAGGHRKTYQVEQEQFERLTQHLVERMEQLTVGLLEENKLGWAHVDVVLTTGGASRMPMVRTLLKKLSGTTLNTSLSPDQSIAHGATYYAGMLLSNNAFARSILNPTAAARLQQFRQQSVNARALGILVRDLDDEQRVPHYMLPANTQLPASVTQMVGTVMPNQKRVHLHIVESGTAADQQFVELGTCVIDPLPPNLPEGTEIEVSIQYDEQARVHVSAKVVETGQEAHTEIVRTENVLVSALQDEAAMPTNAPQVPAPSSVGAKPQPKQFDLDSQEVPVPVREPAGQRDPRLKPRAIPEPQRPAGPAKSSSSRPAPPPLPMDDEIIDLEPVSEPPRARPKASAPPLQAVPKVKPQPLPPLPKKR